MSISPQLKSGIVLSLSDFLLSIADVSMELQLYSLLYTLLLLNDLDSVLMSTLVMIDYTAIGYSAGTYYDSLSTYIQL